MFNVQLKSTYKEKLYKNRQNTLNRSDFFPTFLCVCVFRVLDVFAHKNISVHTTLVRRLSTRTSQIQTL